MLCGGCLYQSKMKHEYTFSIKTVRVVIIAMTCTVEVKLATEMKAAGKGRLFTMGGLSLVHTSLAYVPHTWRHVSTLLRGLC
jgi:hypothetical protein